MCLNPITLKPQFNKHDGKFHSYTVPCGKCLDCKRQYQNSWYIRMYEEAKRHSNIIFFTLTYREKKSPLYWRYNRDRRQYICPFYVDRTTGECHRTVYKEHVQKWLKRFRITLQRKAENATPKEFKYFITSEYGPRTLRPHYHGIFFGITEHEFRIAYEDWMDHYGNVEYSVISITDEKYKQNAIRYVSKYCSKGFFENPKVEQGLVAKTFHLISKKIGSNYIDNYKAYHLAKHLFSGKRMLVNHVYSDEYLKYIVDCRKCQIGNCKYSMPRYYREKIYGAQSNLSYQMSEFIRKQSDKLYLEQLYALQTEMSLSEAVNFIELQNIMEINQRRRSLYTKMSKFYDKSKI